MNERYYNNIIKESQRSDFAEVVSAGGYDFYIFNISAEKQKQL